jgi:hypothetical protein
VFLASKIPTFEILRKEEIEKISIAEFVIDRILEVAGKEKNEYYGTREFKAHLIHKIFENDKVLQLDSESPRAQNMRDFDFSSREWFAQNEIWGTSEEEAFLRFVDERKYLKSYIDKLVSSVIEAGLAKKLPFDFEQALKYVQLLDQNNVLLSSALVAIKLPKERQHEKERALANIDPSITPSDFDRYVDVFKALASNQEAVFDKKNASSTFLSTTFS